MGYEQIRQLAQSLGYTSLTALQERTFRGEDTFREEQNLMIIGPTSSGKTLVPLLLYYSRVLEAVRDGIAPPHLLFIVPYRALASQKCAELTQRFNEVYGGEHTLSIAQSTGEYRDEDPAILHGELDISVVINEKAFLFASSDNQFLSRFDMIVFDEIGLLKDESRGLKLDFLMSWIRSIQLDDTTRYLRKPQMICLGTPFYDWSFYSEAFRFSLKQAGDRPELQELPVYLDLRGDSLGVELPHWPDKNGPAWSYRRYRGDAAFPAVRCPYAEDPDAAPCRDKQWALRRIGSRTPCPAAGRPCPYQVGHIERGVPRRFRAIADLCLYHLKQNRQILIFWNDRESVRLLCLYLYRELKPLLRAIPDTDACRRRVLTACADVGRTNRFFQESEDFTGDDLYGLFEEEHYQAFCAGISFHSSALPAELRAVVEEQFLGTHPSLRIVCSTETLAYGVNSAVDVVIVASMKKNIAGVEQFLTPNEYQNYAGRAGRLHPGQDFSSIVGYVHPVVCVSSAGGEEFQQFRQMKQRCEVPEPIASSLYRDNDYLPFMVLCLMPDQETQAISEEQVRRWIHSMPALPGAAAPDVNQILTDLARNGLIRMKKTAALYGPLSHSSRQYYTTGRGALVKGYTPSMKDYQRLLSAMKRSIDPDSRRLNEPALMFHLLDTDCLRKIIESMRLGHKLAPAAAQGENSREKQQFADRFSEANLPDTLSLYGCRGPMEFLLRPYERGEKPMDRRTRVKLLLTAAILSWAETANPRILYQHFEIPYPMIQSLTRQLSYMLEIVSRSTFVLQGLCSQSEEELSVRISTLERSVTYGINTDAYNRLIDFFSADPSEESRRIVRRIKNLQPAMARQIRGVIQDSLLLQRVSEQGGQDGQPYGENTAMSALQAIRRTCLRGPLWVRYTRSLL